MLIERMLSLNTMLLRTGLLVLLKFIDFLWNDYCLNLLLWLRLSLLFLVLVQLQVDLIVVGNG